MKFEQWLLGLNYIVTWSVNRDEIYAVHSAVSSSTAVPVNVSFSIQSV